MTNTKITKKNEKEKKMTNTKITKKNEKEKKMKKEFTINKRIEQNPFADPRKANNGGGYSQPYIEFTFRGKTGSISDTSCGDFGNRIEIVYGEKKYYLDSISREYIEYSTFSKCKHSDIQAVNEIKKHTGYNVCFKEEILKLKEKRRGWKRKRHEELKLKEKRS